MVAFVVEDAHPDPLATYRASSTRLPLLTCPNKASTVLVNTVTGVVLPALCGRVSCYVCVAPTAIGVGQAIAMARPSQAILLTDVGDEWPVIQQRMNRFRALLKRRGFEGKDAWLIAVEGVVLVGASEAGRGRGLPRMEVPTPAIRKTSTCLTLPSPALT